MVVAVLRQVFIQKGREKSWTARLHDELAASDEARNRQFWVRA
jgi:hypothetical protein